MWPLTAIDVLNIVASGSVEGLNRDLDITLDPMDQSLRPFSRFNYRCFLSQAYASRLTLMRRDARR